MKKILSLLMVLTLMCSLVLAAPQVQRNSKGDLVVGITEQERVQTSSQLREEVQQRSQEMEQSMAGLDSTERNVLRNQNQVRLAVHSFLAMEDLVGGIGKQVSAIAREFDSSVQKTIKAEERVQTRSSFARFFVGGDSEAAEDLDKEVMANKIRIQQLKQLKEQCDCGSDVKAMFQEQVVNMEQEQERLGKLAREEKSSKGLFGWIWK